MALHGTILEIKKKKDTINYSIKMEIILKYLIMLIINYMENL